MHRTAPALALTLIIVALGACTSTTTTGSGTTLSEGTVDLLHDGRQAAKALAAIERAVGSSPARVVEVDFYPEYLIVEAQDPAVLDHIDRYEWRDGEVAPSAPVELSGPQEAVTASLFPTSAVRWTRLAAMVADAERAALHNTPLRIEEPHANYVFVERSTSPADDGRVLVRIYLEGPRRSGSVEMTATGDIRSVNVS